jgi:hypothetical protein
MNFRIYCSQIYYYCFQFFQIASFKSLPSNKSKNFFRYDEIFELNQDSDCDLDNNKNKDYDDYFDEYYEELYKNNNDYEIIER